MYATCNFCYTTWPGSYDVVSHAEFSDASQLIFYTPNVFARPKPNPSAGCDKQPSTY
jgi:hypothetical protein